jgi:hypothetical protein
MHATQESRTGRDRRQNELAPISPTDIERRCGRNQRSKAIDEDAIYAAKAEEPKDYWESLFSIPSENCK